MKARDIEVVTLKTNDGSEKIYSESAVVAWRYHCLRTVISLVSGFFLRNPINSDDRLIEFPILTVFRICKLQ